MNSFCYHLQMFGKVLMDDFKSELSGNYRKLVRAMMLPPPLFDAHELRNAMKGLGELTLASIKMARF